MTPMERLRAAFVAYMKAKKAADKAQARDELLKVSDEVGIGIRAVVEPVELRKVMRDTQGSAFWQRWTKRVPA